MMPTLKGKGMGWIPSPPDPRDYKYRRTIPVRMIPDEIDMRGTDSPIEDQGDLGCHDSETEVLTYSGWKLFQDVTNADELATVDPITRELFFEKPISLMRFQYNGELVCAENQSLNFRVTPNHNMLVRKWNEGKRKLNENYEFVRADNIGWYCGLMNRVIWNKQSGTTYTLIGVNAQHKEQRKDVDIPLKYWMRFLGIYTAEGTILKEDQCKNRITYKIQIAGTKEREKYFIREVLNEIGVSFLELKDRFTINNKRLYKNLELIGLKGIKAPYKFVPKFVFDQSSEMINEFLLGHFMGDGCSCDGVNHHYTSSSVLADDLQTLIFMSGNESKISVRQRESKIFADGHLASPSFPEHRISSCSIKNLSIERKGQIFKTQYNGEVFCAEVPTYHTLVTRRSGKILISGNSCTAFSISGAMQFLEKADGYPLVLMSQLQMYYDIRPSYAKSYDSGGTMRDAAKVGAKTGGAKEELWPYETSKFTNKPTQTVYDDAAKRKVTEYSSISPTANNLKGCLAEGHPFIFGFTVKESFENIGSDGIMPVPKTGEDVLGGHAVMCLGYKMINGKLYWIIRNSWGTSWGDKGYFYMPDSVMLSSDCSDYWRIAKVASPDTPTPTPTPTPEPTPTPVPTDLEKRVAALEAQLSVVVGKLSAASKALG